MSATAHTSPRLEALETALRAILRAWDAKDSQVLTRAVDNARAVLRASDAPKE